MLLVIQQKKVSGWQIILALNLKRAIYFYVELKKCFKMFQLIVEITSSVENLSNFNVSVFFKG